MSELEEEINQLEKVVLSPARDYDHSWMEIHFSRIRSLIMSLESEKRIAERMAETGVRYKKGGGFEHTHNNSRP